MFSHHPLEYIATIASRQILQAQQELQVIIYFYIYKYNRFSKSITLKKYFLRYYRHTHTRTHARTERERGGYKKTERGRAKRNDEERKRGGGEWKGKRETDK